MDNLWKFVVIRVINHTNLCNLRTRLCCLQPKGRKNLSLIIGKNLWDSGFLCTFAADKDKGNVCT